MNTIEEACNKIRDYTKALAFKESKTLKLMQELQNPKQVRESLEKTEDHIKELNGTTKVY